jgi:hypothetical protein
MPSHAFLPHHVTVASFLHFTPFSPVYVGPPSRRLCQASGETFQLQALLRCALPCKCLPLFRFFRCFLLCPCHLPFPLIFWVHARVTIPLRDSAKSMSVLFRKMLDIRKEPSIPRDAAFVLFTSIMVIDRVALLHSYSSSQPIARSVLPA